MANMARKAAMSLFADLDSDDDAPPAPAQAQAGEAKPAAEAPPAADKSVEDAAAKMGSLSTGKLPKHPHVRAVAAQRMTWRGACV
jgi:hypothetical protein